MNEAFISGATPKAATLDGPLSAPLKMQSLCLTLAHVATEVPDFKAMYIWPLKAVL